MIRQNWPVLFKRTFSSGEERIQWQKLRNEICSISYRGNAQLEHLNLHQRERRAGKSLQWKENGDQLGSLKGKQFVPSPHGAGVRTPEWQKLASQIYSVSPLPTWPHDLSLQPLETALKEQGAGRRQGFLRSLSHQVKLSSLLSTTTVFSPYQLPDRKATLPGTTSQQCGCKAHHLGPLGLWYERCLSLTSLGAPPHQSFSFSLTHVLKSATDSVGSCSLGQATRQTKVCQFQVAYEIRRQCCDLCLFFFYYLFFFSEVSFILRLEKKTYLAHPEGYSPSEIMGERTLSYFSH